MPAPYELENIVIAEVNKYFNNESKNTVLNLLKITQLWAEESGPPTRIHLAMLRKSKGDIKVFENSIKYDAGDWRDLLVETGLSTSDWRQKI